MREEPRAFQDFYPEAFSHCYGCGRLNPQGLKIRSFWEGEESVCRFRPQPYHTALPGTVYGGLIASLIDCHGTGTAAAAKLRAEGRDPGSDPPVRFVTASLHVDYLRPTPLSAELELRGRVKALEGRRAVIEIRLLAAGEECARGEVTAVQVNDAWIARYLR